MAEVIAGAEPFSADGGELGCLVLHGFTSNPSSVRPLGEALADAGFAVELPRLPGHGTTWRELQRTRWRDWVREARAALRLLRVRTEQQVVVGQSMGGTLALHLAETEGSRLAGVVVINPFLQLRDPRAPLLPLLQHVLRTAPGVGNDIARRGADERPYDRVPLRALASLVKLQRSVRAHLDQVATPVLVMTSAHDHVVDPRDSQLVLDGVASDDVEQVRLERCYHVATLDHDAELIAQQTVAFVRRVTAGERRQATASH